MRYFTIAVLALGVTVPAFAGETITEHETYEKRSSKIETVPQATETERTVEETQTTRTDRPRVIEKKTTVVPGPVVRERKTEVETHEGD